MRYFLYIFDFDTSHFSIIFLLDFDQELLVTYSFLENYPVTKRVQTFKDRKIQNANSYTELKKIISEWVKEFEIKKLMYVDHPAFVPLSKFLKKILPIFLRLRLRTHTYV